MLSKTSGCKSFPWVLCLAVALISLNGTGCSTPEPGPAVSQAELDADLSSGKMVLVKFGAKWCGPCRLVDAELGRLAEKEPDLKIVEVDVDTNQELAKKYKVNSIPNMVLIRSNEILDRQVGFMSADDISGWVSAFATAESRDAT
jgi:thioredoxin 1